MLPLTPLHDWIAGTVRPGTAAHGRPAPLTREDIAAYQLDALNRTIEHARQSPFYAPRLARIPRSGLKRIEDTRLLPFTTTGDLREDPMRFLCVSQSRIADVVTLHTTGTTGSPKRLFFTADDLERTVSFFEHGMPTMIAPGQSLLVLMPGPRPGSVGGLLTTAMARIGVSCHVHGLVGDPAAAARDLLEHGADCVVGFPAQVLGLARYMEAEGLLRESRVSSVLLSGDHVTEALRAAIAKSLGCLVFAHYGLTETGLGGGVECAARDGYHLRESDLLFEIVDPETDEAVPEGEPGEIVVTTLSREGMPLIRYRTGDMARFRTEPCPCGTSLRRLGRVHGRRDETVRLAGGDLRTSDLDQALLPLPGLLSYGAAVDAADGGRERLGIILYLAAGADARSAARNALDALAALPAASKADGALVIETECSRAWPWSAGAPPKSRINDRRTHA